MKYFILFLLISSSALLAQNSMGTIYLTFDDGPINATESVLRTLKQEGIKATFFINGFHLFGEGDENEDRATEALTLLMNDGHIIANHSYDHMLHNCSDGKRSGAAYCNEVGLWQVGAYGDPHKEYTYFTLNEEKLYAKVPTLKNHRSNRLTSLVRLPYTNNWRVTESLKGDALCSTTDSLLPWDGDYVCDPQKPSKSVQNAIALTNMLADSGFTAFGWDIDWGPTDWGVKYPTESMVSGEALLKQVEVAMDSSTARTMLPLNSRCHTFPEKAFERKGKVVVLAHDFLFEDGKRGKGATINLPKLQKFIQLAKKKGYRFDTVDNYLSN